MTSRMITLRVSALVVVLILLQGESSEARGLTVNDTNGFWDHTTISIYNDIDAEQLTIHCKSKDDDLGVHVLKKGESWQFSFDPNLFGSTLFYSSFEWNGQLHYFDVYKQDRDYRYKEIGWKVTTTGLCYTIKGDEYCYPWN